MEELEAMIMEPIEDKTFRGFELMIMRNAIVNILTAESTEMIINYQVDPNADQRPTQPSLINRLNY